MFNAAETGKLAAVQLLLRAGVDPNRASGFGPPLAVAAHFGHLDVVRALLNAGADVNGNGVVSPLRVALDSGHNDIAALLRQRGGHA